MVNTTPEQWDPFNEKMWIAINRGNPKDFFACPPDHRTSLEKHHPGKFVFISPGMVIHFFNDSMLRIGLNVNGMLSMTIDPHYQTVLDGNRLVTGQFQQIPPLQLAIIEPWLGDIVIPFPIQGIPPDGLIRHDKGHAGKIIRQQMKKGFL